jgi:hypothetical protein
VTRPLRAGHARLYRPRRRSVAARPRRSPHGLRRRVNNTLLALVAARGGDVAWGARAYGSFIRAGLADVSATSRASVWRGGDAGCLLHRTSTLQLESQPLAAGLTAAELEAFRELMLDRRFAVNSYLTVTVRGRRPAVDG